MRDVINRRPKTISIVENKCVIDGGDFSAPKMSNDEPVLSPSDPYETKYEIGRDNLGCCQGKRHVGAGVEAFGSEKTEAASS